MSDPLISVLVSTSNRPEALVRCVRSVLSQTYENTEVLVLDNSPDVDTCERTADEFSDSRIKCTHIDEAYGVAGSRNWLMERASGDIFVVVDDDAYFESEHALERIVARFDDDIGIQAFKIVDHPNNGEERILAPIPKSHRDWQSIDKPFRTTYFVGGGHAIRREVIKICGNYNDDLVYGAEELDLSYRVIEAGFEVLYNPDVVVHHHPEPAIITSDRTGNSELYYSVRNKLYIAYRYLPLKYLSSYVSVWLAYYAAKSVKAGMPLTFLRGIIGGIKLCQSTTRSPISPQTEKYLKANHGRLWY